MLGKKIERSLSRQVSGGLIKTGSMITVEPVIRIVSKKLTLRIGMTNRVNISHRYMRIEFSEVELEGYFWRLLELGSDTPSVVAHRASKVRNLAGGKKSHQATKAKTDQSHSTAFAG